MKKTITPSILFLIGGGLYYMLEILWRGESHWTMFFVGGLCFLLLSFLNDRLKASAPLIFRCLLGALLITAVEFCSGCLINRLLAWDVWDYSENPLNLLGQISLGSSILWLLLTLPAFFLAESLESIIKTMLSKFSLS